MLIHELISKIPYLRQALVINFFPDKVVGENVRTRVRCSFPRDNQHPRTIASDLTSIENEIKKAISELAQGKWIMPKILICLDGINEGGYTDVEKWAFIEAGLKAGAMEICIFDKIISHSDAYEILVTGVNET